MTPPAPDARSNSRPTARARRNNGQPDADEVNALLAGDDHGTPIDTARPAAAAQRPVTAQRQPEPPPFTRLLTGRELLALDLRPRFLVKGVMVAGQPMVIGARSKAMKTSIAEDLIVSLGSGTPFLGRFETERVAVGFWSGESGAATIRETAKRVAASKGISLVDADCLWCFDLPRLSRPEHLEHLEQTIRAQGIHVAILDPLYLCLLSAETASGASNVFLMGPMLQGLTELGQRSGCTIVLIHHFRKSGAVDEDNPCPLEELAQAGVAEWARQWILLQRRIPYQGDGTHQLWMRCGGSAGHASLWAADIDEGIIDPDSGEGRHWEVTLAGVGDARAEAARQKENRKAEQQEAREVEHRERLLRVLRTCRKGETAKQLRETSGLNGKAFSKAITSLLQEGRAKACQVKKGNCSYDGYRPTRKK